MDLSRVRFDDMHAQSAMPFMRACMAQLTSKNGLHERCNPMAQTIYSIFKTLFIDG
jgi:hypothetical protein